MIVHILFYTSCDVSHPYNLIPNPPQVGNHLGNGRKTAMSADETVGGNPSPPHLSPISHHHVRWPRQRLHRSRPRCPRWKLGFVFRNTQKQKKLPKHRKVDDCFIFPLTEKKGMHSLLHRFKIQHILSNWSFLPLTKVNTSNSSYFLRLLLFVDFLLRRKKEKKSLY